MAFIASFTVLLIIVIHDQPASFFYEYTQHISNYTHASFIDLMFFLMLTLRILGTCIC